MALHPQFCGLDDVVIGLRRGIIVLGDGAPIGDLLDHPCNLLLTLQDCP